MLINPGATDCSGNSRRENCITAPNVCIAATVPKRISRTRSCTCPFVGCPRMTYAAPTTVPTWCESQGLAAAFAPASSVVVSLGRKERMVT